MPVSGLPRAAWVVLGGDALSALGSGLTLPFLVVYLHQARGLELALAGLALACIAGAGLAANPLGGWLGDRLGPRTAFVAGLVVAAAGSLAVAGVRAPWQAIAAAALLGTGAGLSLPALDALLASVVAPQRRADAFGARHATLTGARPARSAPPTVSVDAGPGGAPARPAASAHDAPAAQRSARRARSRTVPTGERPAPPQA